MKMTNRLIAFLLLINSFNQIFAAHGSDFDEEGDPTVLFETPEQVLFDIYNRTEPADQETESYQIDRNTLNLVAADQYQIFLKNALKGSFAKAPLTFLLLNQEELHKAQKLLPNKPRLVHLLSSSLTPATINERLANASFVVDNLSSLYCLSGEKTNNLKKQEILTRLTVTKNGTRKPNDQAASVLAGLATIRQYNGALVDASSVGIFHTLTTVISPPFSYDDQTKSRPMCALITDIKAGFDSMKTVLTNAGPITLDLYFKYSTSNELFNKALERYKEGFKKQIEELAQEKQEASKTKQSIEPTLAQWTVKTAEQAYDEGKRVLEDLVASVWRRSPPAEGQQTRTSGTGSPAMSGQAGQVRAQGASSSPAASPKPHQLVVADEEEIETDMLPELCSLFNRTEKTLKLAKNGTAQQPDDLKQSWALLAEFLNTTHDQFGRMTQQGLEANVKKIQPSFPLNAPLQLFFGVTAINDLTQAIVNNQFKKLETAAQSKDESEKMFLEMQRDFVNEKLKGYGVYFGDSQSFMKGVRQARYQFAQVLGIERYKALMEDLRTQDSSFSHLTQLQKAFGAAAKEVGLDVQKCSEISSGLNFAKMPTEGKQEIEAALEAITAMNAQTRSCPQPSILTQVEKAVLNLFSRQESPTEPTMGQIDTEDDE